MSSRYSDFVVWLQRNKYMTSKDTHWLKDTKILLIETFKLHDKKAPIIYDEHKPTIDIDLQIKQYKAQQSQ